MQTFAKTNRGLVRTQNQDAFCVGTAGTTCWAVVCDGMGGSAAGNIASQTATDVFSAAMEENLKPTTPLPIAEKLMTQAIHSANAAVFAAAGENADLEGMGTTVVACVVVDGQATIANVGDSRAYLLRKNKVLQLTTDHSVVQSLVENGQLTADQAKNHPNKNIITRAIGVEPEVRIDFYNCTLQAGDMLLLCTDGLTNCVDLETMSDLAGRVLPEVLPEELVAAALSGGGTDNITAVILQQEQI